VDVGRRLQPLATRPKHTHHNAVSELMPPFSLFAGRAETTREMRRVKSSQVNTLPKAKSLAKDKRAKDRQ